ncbi:serine hydrolase domain-containing protein [Aquihabitans sp. McL0605]|uniref:serine hydrolase domain-containing protein n=1 Tax=Aquihabitans sp. McL0605 TaxID=3415671 RepID=UPI003CEFBC94
MTEIHGTCKPEFDSVRTAFAANFDAGIERGASVSVTLRGEPVVDLWAGDADGAGTPWQQDTIVNCWSVTKTMSAIVVLVLADRGELDLDAPIAAVWPEFGAGGKGDVTMAHVLGHTSPVPGFSPAIAATDLYDHDLCAANLAASEAWWPSGTHAGYHAITQGYVESEVVRRLTGRTIGQYFRDEIAGPLGADFHIGLPESEEPRVGEMVPPGNVLGALEGADTASMDFRILASAPVSGEEQNTRAWRAAEIPSAGGTGNARSVARVHALIANGGTLDGVRILSPEGVERIFTEQWNGPVDALGMTMRLGTGFGLMSESTPLSPNPRSCFWGGWGGAICVIDADLELSVAYVMNKMAGGLVGDLRGAVLALTAIGAASA